jgi:hypothetical protein
MRRRTIGGLALGGLVTTIGGLALIGYGYLQTDSGAVFLEEKVEQAVRNAIEDGGFSIGNVDVRGDALVIRDIRLDGVDTPGVVQIDRVHADLDASAVLRQTIGLEDVRLEGVRLDLPRRADGSLDLPTFVSSPNTGARETSWMPGGWSLDADDVRITEARVALPDDDLLLTDLDASFDLESDANGLTIDALDGSLLAEAPELDRTAFAGSVRLRGSSLESAELAVALPQSTVDLSLAMPELLDSASPLQLALDSTASLDRAPLRELLTWSDNASAAELLEPGDDLTVRAAIDGPLDALGVDAELAIGETPVLDADGTVAIEDDATAIDVRCVSSALGTLLSEVGAPVQADRAVVPLTLVVPRDGPITLAGTFDLTQSTAADTLNARRLSGRFDGTVAPDVRIAVDAETPSLHVDAGTALHTAVEADIVVTDTAVWGAADLAPDTDTPTRIATGLSFVYETGALELDATRLFIDDALAVRGEGPITAVYRDGGLDALDARLSQPDAGHAHVDLDRISADRQQGRVTAAALDLAPLSTLLTALGVETPELSGTVTGALDADVRPATRSIATELVVTGAAADAWLEPTTLVLDATVREDALDGVLVATDGAARPGEPTDPSAVVASLEWDATLPAAGWVPTCTSDLTADLTVPESRLASLAARIVPLTDPELDATVLGTAHLDGPVCDPEIDLAVSAAGLYRERAVTVDARLSDGRTHETVLDAELVMGDHRVAWLEGTASHPEPREWVAADDPIAALERWSLGLELEDAPTALVTDAVGGRFVGGAKVVGARTTPERVSGGLALADGQVSGISLERADLLFDTVAGRVEADAVLEAAPRTDAEGIRLNATAALELDELLNRGTDAGFEADIAPSRIPLALVAAVAPDTLEDASGTLAIDATADGTFAEPSASGEVTVENGDLVLRALGVRYYDIDLEATLDGTVVELQHAALKTRPRYGRFSNQESTTDLILDGVLALEDAGPVVRLETELDGFWAIANNTGIAQLDGTLGLAGPLTNPTLTGDLVVDDARFELGRYLFVAPAGSTLHEDIVFVTETPDRLSTSEPEPSLLDRARIQLDVDVGRSAELEATVPLAADAGLVGTLGDASIDASVDGGVDVAMRDGDPSVKGRIETEGEASLLSARFDIDRGTMAFGGRNYTSPNLDFTLRRQSAEGGTVTARVRGTPSDIRIDQLVSDQGLSRADIMAQLLFGRPLSDLGGGDGVSGAALVQNALLSVAGSELENAVGVELVDSIDYSSNEGLSVGWSVGQNAFLTVQLDPSAAQYENTTEVQLSWLLGSFTEAEVKTGDRADSSAWLLFEETF